MAPHQQPRWTARGLGLAAGGFAGAGIRETVRRLSSNQRTGSAGPTTGPPIYLAMGQRLDFDADSGATIDYGLVQRVSGTGPTVTQSGGVLSLSGGVWIVTSTVFAAGPNVGAKYTWGHPGSWPINDSAIDDGDGAYGNLSGPGIGGGTIALSVASSGPGGGHIDTAWVYTALFCQQ